MNCLGRIVSRTRLSSGKQLRRSHDDSLAPAEALKDIKLWKVGSFAGLAFLGVMLVKMLMAPHHHYEFLPYNHLNTNTKELPWGDGKTPMFHYMFGNPYAHDEEIDE
eukprot:TRINITY_DN280_c0_g2_i1.p2 TRINITY_DN280_c0_g2~~TRINITY_DN280_c0_g2_i1.p2  ORF type:complete len:125 (-),score=29.41 TRINITY_DN280_c0_g2_i1:32-352(-)